MGVLQSKAGKFLPDKFKFPTWSFGLKALRIFNSTNSEETQGDFPFPLALPPIEQ